MVINSSLTEQILRAFLSVVLCSCYGALAYLMLTSSSMTTAMQSSLESVE